MVLKVGWLAGYSLFNNRIAAGSREVWGSGPRCETYRTLLWFVCLCFFQINSRLIWWAWMVYSKASTPNQLTSHTCVWDTCVQLQHVDWTQMCKYFTFNCFCHSLKHICFLFWAEIVGLLEVIKKYSRKILFDVSFLLSAQFRCTLQKGLCFQWIYNTYLHWSQYFILENGCNNHKTLQLYRRLQKSIMYDATMPRRQRWTGSTW